MDDTEDTRAEEWISLIMEKYEGILLGYAYNMTGNYSFAQDVVQDTFLKLCKADRGKIDRYVKNWLFKVCRNRILEILRRERKMETITENDIEKRHSDFPSPAEKIEEEDNFKKIIELIDKLPDKQKEIIYLKFQSNLSYKEISEIAEISISNVGFILHTALKTLRNQVLREV